MAYTYDKDTDYQALIDQAVASGDMNSAAIYEQQRNTKINDLNATGTNIDGVTTTNNYSQYLNQSPTNYTGSATGVGVHTTDQAAIRDQMNANSQAWWNADDATKAQLEAENQKLAAQLGSGVTYDSATGTWGGSADPYEILRPTFDYDQYLSENAKPTYESNYSAQIDQLLNQILNRDKFSYDPESDQLYQAYKNQYNREGNRSMQNTLASMASSAGGMNSWAATAAQQANDYYATQLTDKIPELAQIAYDMYLKNIDLDMQEMGLLEQLDETQYGRYRDTVNDWYNDRDFAYGNYRDEMGDYQWDTSFEYGQNRDAVEDERYEADRALENSRYEKETAYATAMDFLSKGVIPPEDILNAAGITPSMAAAYVNVLMNGLGSAGGSGGGSDIRRVNNDDIDAIDPNTWEDDGNALTGAELAALTNATDEFGNSLYEIDMASVNQVGAQFGNGVLSAEALADLVENGLVEAYLGDDGKIKFAEVYAYTSDRRPANQAAGSTGTTGTTVKPTTTTVGTSSNYYADLEEQRAAEAAAQKNGKNNSTVSTQASQAAASTTGTNVDLSLVKDALSDWLNKKFK